MIIYVFSGLSLIWTVTSAFLVFFRYSKKEHISGRLPVVTLYTVCLFFSVWLMLLPLHFSDFEFGDSIGFTKPLFLSLLNTMQMFILEGSTDTYGLLKSAAGDGFPAAFRVLYSDYAAILLVAAPLMTFSNALLLLGSWWEDVRFWFRRKGSVYIMSELNSRSVMLANSIISEKPEEKPVIVFADMARSSDDENYNQILDATNMNAILLKKDITRIGLKSLKKAELFFINDNESENIDNAVMITKELSRCIEEEVRQLKENPASMGKTAREEEEIKQDMKLFPFSHGRAGGHILDSLDEYESLTENAKLVNKTFKLRRIDDIMLSVQSEVANTIGKELFKYSSDKLISVLIVGMGDFGTEFFKMLSWYCQIDGYKLEINLADRSPDLEVRLRRDFPELMEYGDDNNTDKRGEENYSVRCLSGTDIIKSDAFAKILQSPENSAEKELSDRLKRTTAVIVALGADTDNIESAIYLRTLFDRACPPADPKNLSYETESVHIYSVVYDEKNGRQDTNGASLINYKGEQYNISLIGGMTARYSHKNIYDPTAEEEAYGRHVAWVKTNNEILAEYDKMSPEERRGDKEIADRGSYSTDDFDAVKELRKYDRFEYFRRSSIASVLHRRMLRKQFPEKLKCLNNGSSEGNKVTCECENCLFLKKTEHMRWYAYMCTEGFIYGKKRADRAKVHHDMKPFSELGYWEKHKDWWGEPESGNNGGEEDS